MKRHYPSLHWRRVHYGVSVLARLLFRWWMLLMRALERKLVMFFFFPLLQKHVPIAHSAMLEGKSGTINTSNGWSSSVKAKREFMKNKQITGNVNQGQWSDYKHRCAIPRASQKENRKFLSQALKSEFEERTNILNNWNQLMRCESIMMSPHHSPVPVSLLVYVFWDHKVLTPNSPPSTLQTHTNMHMCAHTCI